MIDEEITALWSGYRAAYRNKIKIITLLRPDYMSSIVIVKF